MTEIVYLRKFIRYYGKIIQTAKCRKIEIEKVMSSVWIKLSQTLNH